VKLTEDSAKALKLSDAIKGSPDGFRRAIVTTSEGRIADIFESVKLGTVDPMLATRRSWWV